MNFNESSSDADLAAALAAALEVSIEVGAKLLTDRGELELFEKSSATDIVTNLDRWSEQTIVSYLETAFPRDGIVGEEGASRKTQSGRTWVIDPIDGTTNFVYGLPHWCISLALVDESTRAELVGVVHAPALAQTFYAQANQGAYLLHNEVRRELKVGAETQLSRALVGTGFGYTTERRIAQARVANSLIPQVRDIRRLGSCALDLCLVASGALDAYFERGVNLWDYAAGVLIAKEAGAIAGGLRGNPYSNKFLLATSPALYPSFEQALELVNADRDNADRDEA